MRADRRFILDRRWARWTLLGVAVVCALVLIGSLFGSRTTQVYGHFAVTANHGAVMLGWCSQNLGPVWGLSFACSEFHNGGFVVLPRGGFERPTPGGGGAAVWVVIPMWPGVLLALPVIVWSVRRRLESGHIELGGLATASGVVGDHRGCVRCGYDVFGLAAEGRCPECGLEVGETLRVELLKRLPREYVRRVRRGYEVARGAIPAVILAMDGWLISMALWGSDGRWWPPRVAVAAAGVAVGAGHLLVTTRSERVDSVPLVRMARLASRGTALALMLVIAAVAAWGPQEDIAVSVPQVIVAVAWAVHLAAMLWYTMCLGMRAPDPVAVKWSTVGMVVIPVVAAAGSVFFGLAVTVALGAYWVVVNRMVMTIREVERVGGGG
ncbi:MAG: hypothetical protein KF745_13795 [Phycisphaeraceae bacterium]|nr:hypothetical protein [Phycisphaeraceae bacterium]